MEGVTKHWASIDSVSLRCELTCPTALEPNLLVSSDGYAWCYQSVQIEWAVKTLENEGEHLIPTLLTLTRQNELQKCLEHSVEHQKSIQLIELTVRNR